MLSRVDYACGMADNPYEPVTEPPPKKTPLIARIGFLLVLLAALLLLLLIAVQAITIMAKSHNPRETAHEALCRVGEEIAEHYGIPVTHVCYVSVTFHNGKQWTIGGEWEVWKDDKWVVECGKAVGLG